MARFIAKPLGILLFAIGVSIFFVSGVIHAAGVIPTCEMFGCGDLPPEPPPPPGCGRIGNTLICLPDLSCGPLPGCTKLGET